MSVCAKFQLSSWSRSGLKVPGGVVGCSVVGCSGVVEAHFSVQLYNFNFEFNIFYSLN